MEVFLVLCQQRKLLWRVSTRFLALQQIKQLSSDLLWSDPAQHEQEKRLDQTGFGEGERGPGAICYGDKAIQNFLDTNGMSHIVRAHEPTQKGINISKGGRVITIFSTSRVPVNVNSED